MASHNKLVSLAFLHFLIALCAAHGGNCYGLKLGFYKRTCPSAETVVAKTTLQFISQTPTLAAPLLRMHFRDCFCPEGCDGSVLLDSTKNNQAEKAAFPNLRLRGYEVIDAAKSKLEKICPGAVSCADILALVARDAVAVGGHTVGTALCSSFTNRLHNFTGMGDADPNLDPRYAANLRKKCKPNDVSSLVKMDPGSFKNFDEDYYTVVTTKRGLLQSDAALLDEPETKAYVKLQETTHGSTFAQDFSESMIKMGKIGVLTGKAGETRKHCAFVKLLK